MENILNHDISSIGVGVYEDSFQKLSPYPKLLYYS